LWNLPYFHDLLLPHNIDVMHTKKNIVEAIFGTIMDIPDKTKDNIKARVDQARLCDRPKMNMAPPRAGKSWRKPKADFVLTRAQRREVLEWFQTLMFPDGYAANLKDMHYEARVQAIIEFYAQYRTMKVKKEEARTMNLTKDQFMSVSKER